MKRMTKARRRVNASKRAKERRVSLALQKFIRAVKPSSVGKDHAMKKNPGGSITIIPLKRANRAKRRAR